MSRTGQYTVCTRPCVSSSVKVWLGRAGVLLRVVFVL